MVSGRGPARPHGASSRRSIDELPAEGLVAALASVGAASDLVEAVDFATALLARLSGGRAIGCLREDERLRVVRHPGLDRSELGAVVSDERFRRLVADWHDRPLPPERAVRVDLEAGGAYVCAPIATGRWHGLLAVPAGSARRTEMLEGLAGHVANVGRRVELERGVERSRAELGAAIQAMPVPVVATDGEGRLTHVNALACEVFSLSGSFDLGRHVGGLLGSPAVEELLLGEDSWFEREVEAGQPPRTWRAVVGQVVDAGRCIARIVSLEDVSAMREGARVKDDFVAVVGHELRTPLTVISGFAQTLASRGEELDADQRREFLTAIANQSGRLGQVVEDLLFLSLERGERSPAIVPGTVEVDRLVRALAAEFALRAPQREIEVTVRGDACAETDRSMAEQALRHLVDNAVKFSDGPVRVEVEGTSDAVSVAVCDEGPGIFSGDLERVFEPFVQLDGSSTRRHGGVGVGLYVARRIVEILGGSLDCDSRLGVGSRFTVSLPRRVDQSHPGVPLDRDVALPNA